MSNDYHQFTICNLLGPYLFLFTASKLSPKCFECHYSKAGDGVSKWQALSRAGYPSCALRHPSDSDMVDKYTCGSGVCFIREESNGSKILSYSEDSNNRAALYNRAGL